MLRPIRKTAQGTEYWDTEAKKVVIGGVDLAGDEESKTVVNGDLLNDDEIINFSKMTVAELKQFAADNDIEFPSDITKKDDIVAYLTSDAE